MVRWELFGWGSFGLSELGGRRYGLIIKYLGEWTKPIVTFSLLFDNSFIRTSWLQDVTYPGNGI